eukprot:gene13805-19720_t
MVQPAARREVRSMFDDGGGSVEGVMSVTEFNALPPRCMSLQQSIVTESGEKVIPGSRRPDGTLRKERKVRAGYTPQEEQVTYQPEVAKAFAGALKCPGLDPLSEASLKAEALAATKTKTQKKNEKRNAKKQEDGDDTPASKPASAAPKAAPTAQLAPAYAESDDPPQVKLKEEVQKFKKKIH